MWLEVKNVEHSIPRCDGLVREREVLMKMAGDIWV